MGGVKAIISKSPVRFIEQLGNKIITSIEQWEALGFKVEEMEEFFGEKLVGTHLQPLLLLMDTMTVTFGHISLHQVEL